MTNLLIRTFIIFGLIFAILWIFVWKKLSIPNPPLGLSTMSVGTQTLSVEVADTMMKRARGLSGREQLPSEQGMFFIFGSPGINLFWMKDMRFPIDILWISANREVVEITSDVRPDTYPTSFTSQVPAQYVLEVPSGWAKLHNIRVGDTVTLPAK